MSLYSDGWSDSQRRLIINFITVTESGPMFLSSVNAKGFTKSRFYIVDRLMEKFREIGHQNVVQIINDNTQACKVAGAIVKEHSSHIFWTPCILHTLNLTFKNIRVTKNTKANEITYKECTWITDVFGDAITIKNFIMNHSGELLT